MCKMVRMFNILLIGSYFGQYFLWIFQVLMIVITVLSERIVSSLARFYIGVFFVFTFYLVQVQLYFYRIHMNEGGEVVVVDFYYCLCKELTILSNFMKDYVFVVITWDCCLVDSEGFKGLQRGGTFTSFNLSNVLRVVVS